MLWKIIVKRPLWKAHTKKKVLLLLLLWTFFRAKCEEIKLTCSWKFSLLWLRPWRLKMNWIQWKHISRDSHSTQFKTISFNFSEEMKKFTRGEAMRGILRGEAMSVKIHADVMQSFYSGFSLVLRLRMMLYSAWVFECQRITFILFSLTFFLISNTIFVFFLLIWHVQSNTITIHLILPQKSLFQTHKNTKQGPKRKHKRRENSNNKRLLSFK